LIDKRNKNEKNKNKRILILLDNHKSRMNRRLMEYAEKLKIDFHTIPPHTSHILQPLDRRTNGVFKAAFEESYNIPQEETQHNVRAALVEAIIVVCLFYFHY
jgi:hypothetical protein